MLNVQLLTEWQWPQNVWPQMLYNTTPSFNITYKTLVSEITKYQNIHKLFGNQKEKLHDKI